MKDRTKELFIRNPDATAKLWRITAQRMRTFTAREYARLQTFPDTWAFVGNNKRDVQLQIGNAVPVSFAKRIALAVRRSLEAQDGNLKAQRRSRLAKQLPLIMD